MPGHGNKIERKFEQAIGALLTEKTVERAAAKVGCTPRTLVSWMRRPDFQVVYRLARQAILERSVARLLAISGKAIDTLEENLICGENAPENRAATIILQMAVKGMETLDLAEAIADLRRQVEEIRHGNRGPETGNPTAPPEHRPGGPTTDAGGTDPRN